MNETINKLCKTYKKQWNICCKIEKKHFVLITDCKI